MPWFIGLLVVVLAVLAGSPWLLAHRAQRRGGSISLKCNAFGYAPANPCGGIAAKSGDLLAIGTLRLPCVKAQRPEKPATPLTRDLQGLRDNGGDKCSLSNAPLRR